MCVSRKVFLKHQANWNTVCGAMQDLPRHNIWSADNPVEVLNEHLLLLVRRFNAGMLLASSRRLIFGGQVIALRLTGKSFSAVK